MAAIPTTTAHLKQGARAVLVRNGVTFKGTLFRVSATPAGDDSYWMLRNAKGHMAIAIREGDALYASNPSPCLACSLTAAGMFTLAADRCDACFDRFL